MLVTRDYSGFPIDRLELLVMMIDEKSLAAFSPSSYLLIPMHGCLRLATTLTQPSAAVTTEFTLNKSKVQHLVVAVAN